MLSLIAVTVLMACGGERLTDEVTIGPTPTLVAPTASATPTPGAVPAETTSLPPLVPMGVERVFPNISFARMVYMAYPDDGTNRLFLVLQPGRIMVFPNEQETTSVATYLDIRELVNDHGNEEGLLGLAFDPDYRTNGYFYVYYSVSGPSQDGR